MTITETRRTEGAPEAAVAGFLRSLLEQGVVEAVLVPRLLPSGDGFVQALTADPAALDQARPLALTMPVQSGRILQALSTGGPRRRVAALLKPCEARAAVELSKFLQVDPEALLTVTIDCGGTLEVDGLQTALAAGATGEDIRDRLLEGMSIGEVRAGGVTVREACRTCDSPAAAGEVVIELFGRDPSREIGITVHEPLAGELRAKGVLTGEGGASATRAAAVERATASRAAARETAFGAFREEVSGMGAFLDRFSACVRCHNCMTACPICYCKECVFRTAVFEHSPEQYLRWARRKGSVRLPSDTLLFHLVRLAHMGTSCVGCGLCDSACPNGLPVSTLFRSVGAEVQGLFGYTPGRDPAEKPPVADFREDELEGDI